MLISKKQKRDMIREVIFKISDERRLSPNELTLSEISARYWEWMLVDIHQVIRILLEEAGIPEQEVERISADIWSTYQEQKES